MQTEGTTTYGSNGAHTWTVWVTRYGGWRWEVSGPLGWMESDGASSKGDAFIAVRQCLLRRGETV
jgi:hypothetical protein